MFHALDCLAEPVGTSVPCPWNSWEAGNYGLYPVFLGSLHTEGTTAQRKALSGGGSGHICFTDGKGFSLQWTGSFWNAMKVETDSITGIAAGYSSMEGYGKGSIMGL